MDLSPQDNSTTVSNDNEIMWQIYLLASCQAHLGTRLRRDDREV